MLSTDRRMTCLIEAIPAAVVIAIRCRTPSIPIDPIAMNTVRIRQCLAKVARIVQVGGPYAQPVGFAEDAAGLVGVTNERGDPITARQHPADEFAADPAGSPYHCGGQRVSFGKARTVRGRTQQNDGAQQG